MADTLREAAQAAVDMATRPDYDLCLACLEPLPCECGVGALRAALAAPEPQDEWETRWRMAEAECDRLRAILDRMRERYKRVTFATDVHAADRDIRALLAGHDKQTVQPVQPVEVPDAE